MDFTFPEKFFEAARYFDYYVNNDLEHTDKLENERKLLFYALRMQAEEGPCRTPAPPFWRVTERYKHQAWSKLGNMSKYEAMVFFVRSFEEVLTAGTSQKGIVWMEKVKELPLPGGGGAEGNGHSPHLVAEGEWDQDLVAHHAPTPENIAYLASQVMLARRQLAEARALPPPPESSANSSSSPRVGASASARPSSAAAAAPSAGLRLIYGPAIVRGHTRGRSAFPPVRAEQVYTASTAVASAGPSPPLRPLKSYRRLDSSVKPPVRLSPHVMATAAARVAAAASPSSPRSPIPSHPQAANGWGRWFDW